MLLPFFNFKFGAVDDNGGGSADDEGGAGSSEGSEGGADNSDVSEGSDGEKGKPSISDAEAKLLKDVMAKKKALKDATDAKNALEAKLKDFDGIDPVEVRKLLQERKEAEVKELEAKGNWDKLKAQMAEAHKAQMAEVQTKAQQLEQDSAKKDAIISELTVGQAFANSPFIKNELVITANITRSAYGTYFGYEDGKVVGYDKPAGREGRTVLVDAVGEPLNFEEALKKIIDADPEKDSILRSKMKGGAGSKSSGKEKAPDPKKTTSDEKGIGRISGALDGFLGKK